MVADHAGMATQTPVGPPVAQAADAAPAASPPVPRPARRSPGVAWRALVAGLLALAVAAAGYFALRPSPPPDATLVADVVARHSAALHDGDGALACSLMTAQAAAQSTRGGTEHDCAGDAEAVGALQRANTELAPAFQFAMIELQVPHNFRVTLNPDHTRAAAHNLAAADTFDPPTVLAKVQGHWLIDGQGDITPAITVTGADARFAAQATGVCHPFASRLKAVVPAIARDTDPLNDDDDPPGFAGHLHALMTSFGVFVAHLVALRAPGDESSTYAQYVAALQTQRDAYHRAFDVVTAGHPLVAAPALRTSLSQTADVITVDGVTLGITDC
jgi:hypothetical protein